MYPYLVVVSSLYIINPQCAEQTSSPPTEGTEELRDKLSFIQVIIYSSVLPILVLRSLECNNYDTMKSCAHLDNQYISSVVTDLPLTTSVLHLD